MLTLFARPLRGLSPTVLRYLLATGLVGFALDGGIYAVLLNLFLLRLDYGPAEIGLINAAGTFTFALASLPAGLLGARLGGRRMLLAGLGMLCAGCTLLPMADTLALALRLAWLLGFAVLIYAGLALFFVNTTPLLLREVPIERRTQVVGLQTALISLSAFAGSLLGGLLPPLFARLSGVELSATSPYRYALIVAGVALVAAIIAVAGAELTVGADEPQPAAPPAPSAGQPAAPPTPSAGQPAPAMVTPLVGLLLMIALVRTLQVAGVAAISSYTNVYLDAALAVPTALIGVIVASGRLIGAAAALTTVGLTTRFGNWAVTFWTSVLSALSMLPIVLIPHWGAVAASFIALIGLSWIRYTASLVYFLELVPEGARPTASGVLEMAAGICFTLVAFGGGLMIARFGYSSLFLTAAAITALSAVTFWGLFRKRVALEQTAQPLQRL